MARRKRQLDHGVILTDEHVDYSTMTKIGRVTIDYQNEPGSHSYGPRVYAEGFEWSDTPSCRQAAARAFAWARDVAAASVEAHKLAPGGCLASGID